MPSITGLPWNNLRQALTHLQVGVFLSPPAGHDFIVLAESKAVQIIPQLRMRKRGGKWRAQVRYLRCYPRDMAAGGSKFRMYYYSLPMTDGQGWSGVIRMGRVLRQETSIYLLNCMNRSMMLV